MNSRLIWEGSIEERKDEHYQVHLTDGTSLEVRQKNKPEERYTNEYSPVYSDHVRIAILNKLILLLLRGEIV